MPRRLKLTSELEESVTARLAMPADGGRVGVVLAHGAGAGQDHPWMVTMRDALAAGGLPTLTFNYPYAEAGRKAPDRIGRLLATHHAAVNRMRTYVDAVVLGGKSMGGRIASHLVGDEGVAAAGLVYYGYPLVALGTRTPRATEHLARIGAAQLFFAGSRDRLSPPDLMGPIVAGLTDGRLIVVDDGDHSFNVPKRSGRTQGDVLAAVSGETVAWARGLPV